MTWRQYAKATLGVGLVTGVLTMSGTGNAVAQGIPQEIQALAAQIASLKSEIRGLTDAAPSARKPKFYLTTGRYDGGQVLNACDTGFHAASIWEIVDPSTLKYDTSRGVTADDSGDGPPGRTGWIRTGSVASSSITDLPNCQAHTVNSRSTSGAVVHLPMQWGASASVIAPWEYEIFTCDSPLPVWCVENQQ